MDDHAACARAAMVATLNASVDDVNDYAVSLLPTKMVEFHAAETLADESLGAHYDLLATMRCDYLSRIETPGIPPESWMHLYN